jgi:magnesium transporter
MSQVFMREVRIALLIALCCGVIGGSICSFLPSFFANHRSATETVDTSSSEPESLLATSGNGASVLSVPAKQLKPNEQFKLAAAFGIAMFSAIMISTSLGLSLPFLFRQIGLDPAISSGPLVTTANDSISVAIYLLLTLLMI